MDAAPASPTTRSDAPRRWVGVDLVRWLAALGVIAIHSGNKTGLADELGAALQRFCVPFFYAAGAFFLVREILEFEGWPRLSRRLRRLLVPYAAWSLIYLGARWLKWRMLGRPPNEPLGAEQAWQVVLLGGAAVHLYFLPVLAVGLILGWALTPLWRQLERRLFVVPWLIAAAFFGAFAYLDILLPAQIGAFELCLWRLGAAAVLFLPWLLTSLLWAAGLDLMGGVEKLQSRPWVVVVLGAIFLAANSPWVVQSGLHPQIHWWILGSLLLITALAWRADWAYHPTVQRWLPWSFGVYLAHHLVIEALRLIARAAHVPWPERITLVPLLGVVLLATAGSLGVVTVLRRWRITRVLLLGE